MKSYILSFLYKISFTLQEGSYLPKWISELYDSMFLLDSPFDNTGIIIFPPNMFVKNSMSLFF